MKDREFLIWIHNRLTEVHGEDSMFDYIHRFRVIIENTPKDRRSINTILSFDINDLIRQLES